jgi:hypothetical protein
MDSEPEEPIKEEQKVEPIEKKRRKPFLLVLLILLLVTSAACAAYWVRDRSAKTTDSQQAATITSLQQTNASLKEQLATEKAKATDTDTAACTVKSPTATVISNIEASITSGNTAALEGYMASSVNVILAASEGLGARTPTQAVSDITGFISSDTTSWDYDFSLPAATLSSYGAGSYSQYFPSGAVTGKATNKQVIAFSFDCNAKISTVFMATNEDLVK